MANQTVEFNDLFTYTENKLQSHFQNNEYFNKQFALMEDYYLKKVQGIIQDEDQKEFEEMFFTSVKSQFFNGYFIIREFVSHEESVLPDEFLSQPDGFLTEEVPELINKLAPDNVQEVVISEDMSQLTKWAITRYENVRETLNRVAYEIACLGAKQALLDERDNRGLEVYKTNEEGLMGVLGDITFINPQIHISPTIYQAESEIWILTWWSALGKKDNKAGEVVITKSSTDNQAQFTLNVYLSHSIPEQERREILETLLMNLMDKEGVQREQVAVSFAVVEEFYILVQE